MQTFARNEAKRREEIVLVKRFLFLTAMLAMLAVMALPAVASHNDYDDDPYDDYGSNSHDDYGDRWDNYRNRWDDYADRYGDDDDYDRYPPGYDDQEEEPRAPDCDWYGPYHERPWDPWYEYWCYWHGWGWEYVFWVYA